MKLKLTTKSQIEKRLLEQKLIANKKMRIYSSASIAANPILCLQFNKFSYSYKNRIRKNKRWSKTDKPHKPVAFTT